MVMITRIFRNHILRLCLEVLAWAAVSVGLAWLLHRYVGILQPHYLSDVLFLIGAFEIGTASFGMMRSPYGVMNGPWGVTALPVQPTEEERRYQAVAEFVERRWFAMHLLGSGLLTILVAVVINQ